MMETRYCAVCDKPITRKRYKRPPERTCCSYACSAELAKGAPTADRIPWDAVRADAANGMTIDALQEKYRVTDRTLKKYDIQRSEPIRPEWREDAQSYKAGVSILELAQRRGIDKETMRSRLVRAGAVIRQRGMGDFVPDLRAYLDENYAIAGEAAQLLGIDPGTFCESLREGRVQGAFLWHGIWFVPLSGIAEYDLRRKQNFPHLFERDSPAESAE